MDFSHCHCSQCRRLHGAAFGSFGGVARRALRWQSGEAALSCYASSDTTNRYFCGNCGSNLVVDYKPERDTLYLTMGTLDGNPECPAGYHQFVGSRAPWFEITDQLPQFAAWPDEDAGAD
jgi:hypothetical protein